MTCCKVPIKISGFSGGCATITGSTATNGAISSLADIGSNTNTPGFVSNIAISNLAYLGLKCVNIACPPALKVDDNLEELASFLDSFLTQVGTYRSSTTGDLVSGATAVTAIKAGIAALIAGCGDCCSQ